MKDMHEPIEPLAEALPIPPSPLPTVHKARYRSPDQQRNLQLWRQALKSGKYERARSVYYNHMTGAYCALGLLRALVVPDKDDWDLYDSIDVIGRMAGLSAVQSLQVTHWNDGNMVPEKSFIELEAAMERHGWFA